MLLTRDSFKVVLFYVICMFCHLVVLVMLTVPVQVIYSSLLVFVYYNFNTFFSCVTMFYTHFVCFSMSRLSVLLGSC